MIQRSFLLLFRSFSSGTRLNAPGSLITLFFFLFTVIDQLFISLFVYIFLLLTCNCYKFRVKDTGYQNQCTLKESNRTAALSPVCLFQKSFFPICALVGSYTRNNSLNRLELVRGYFHQGGVSVSPEMIGKGHCQTFGFWENFFQSLAPSVFQNA